MRKEIEIVNGAVQYGDLGQLKSSEVILHFIFDDKPLSIRADVAIDYMLKGMGELEIYKPESELLSAPSLTT